MYSGFAEARTIAVMTFVDPAGLTLYRDWPRASQAAVANLRPAQGRRPRDPRLLGPVARLAAVSSLTAAA